MYKQMIRETFVWGLALWFIGYALGIVLFFIVPSALIGWVIMPIGILITLWVLFNEISDGGLQKYLLLAVVWTLIAMVCDYFLLVKVFDPTDGYYKLDVYLYYGLTFALPLIAGFIKNKNIR